MRIVIVGQAWFGAEALPSRAAKVADLLHSHETRLLQPLLDYLAQHPRVRLIGSARASQRAPTVAFAVAGQRPRDLATRLAQSKIGVGCGNFYAYRLLQALGIDTDDGVLRVSFVHYTSRHEVDLLIAALDGLLQE